MESIQGKYLTQKKQTKAINLLLKVALMWITLLWGVGEVMGQVAFQNSAFNTIPNGTTATSIAINNYDPGSANNRFMVVAVTTSRRDVFSATFGGEPLEELADVVNGNSRVVFFTMTDPPSGPAQLTATLESDDRGFVIGVATFSNVDLTNPMKAFTSATGSSEIPTVSNIPTEPGSFVFSAVSYRNGSRIYNGVGTGQTQRWQFQSANSNDRHWSIGSTKNIASGTTTSVSYSFSNSENFSAGAVSINPIPVANLGITKIVDIDKPFAGQTINFTLTANNAGPNNAPNVEVLDQLPSGFTYISHVASAGTTFNAGAGVWSIGTLNNGASATLTITAVVNATGNYTNVATISGDVIDNNPGNNTAQVVCVLCGAGGNPPLFKSN